MSPKLPTVFIKPLSVWYLLLIIIISGDNTSEINSSLTFNAEKHHQHKFQVIFPRSQKNSVAEHSTYLGFLEPQDTASISGLLFSGIPEMSNKDICVIVMCQHIIMSCWVKDKLHNYCKLK